MWKMNTVDINSVIIGALRAASKYTDKKLKCWDTMSNKSITEKPTARIMRKVFNKN